MSRGPGRWQRAILDATETAAAAIPEWIALDTLGVSVAPSDPAGDVATLSRAEAVARRRAAHALADRGVIQVTSESELRAYRWTHTRWETHEGQTGWWRDSYSRNRWTPALQVRRTPTPEQTALMAARLADLEQRLRSSFAALDGGP